MDSNFKDKIYVNGDTTRIRKDYCKYGGKPTDKYCHVYQYWNFYKSDYDDLIEIARLKIEEGFSFKK